MSHDVPKDQQPARGRRYVGLAVIPRRRRAIERALGRIVELGGEALLITADGSSRARWPGVEHLDLLSDEMRYGPNRLIAVSPKRVLGKLVGRRVGGRSLLWRGWIRSRPYKAVRYYALWHVLERRRDVLRPADTTDLLLAGVESWPIAWHIAQENSTVAIGWDVPDAWKRPVEDELLGLKRVAVWGGNPSWHILSRGGAHSAESVTSFGASSWVAQASGPAHVDDLVPEGEGFEQRVVRADLTATLVSDIIELEPHVVLVDAAVELSDILHIGEWCTLSEFTEELDLDSRLRERSDRVIAWDDPERAELLRESVTTVARQLLDGLPDARFVLHRIRLTDRTNPSGEAPSEGSTGVELIDRMNAVLARSSEIIGSAFGERLTVLDVPAALRVAGKPHPSGPVQAGFSSAYYESALDVLDAIARQPGAAATDRAVDAADTSATTP